MMDAPPLIDRAMLDDLIESIGDDGARSVLELFIGESGHYLATIAEGARDPADAAGRERARRAAHSLKSGAGQVGAAAIAAAADAVENAAASGSPDLPAAAAALQQVATETIVALQALLNAGTFL